MLGNMSDMTDRDPLVTDLLDVADEPSAEEDAMHLEVYDAEESREEELDEITTRLAADSAGHEVD